MEIQLTGNKYSILAKDNMTDRSIIVIKIARINRINKSLSYLLELKEDFYISALDPDFCKIGEWALEIQQYWRECKSPIVSNQINNIGSSGNFYKLLLSAKLPDDVMGAISLYIDTMKELRAEIKADKNLRKGVYSMLPDILANNKAATLLQRAVDAGYLTEEYQPGEYTSNAQLRFLAFGIGTALHLKHKWEPFERLWNREKLPGVYIPSSKSVDFEDIIALYPEVDFTKISDIRNTIQSIIIPSYEYSSDTTVEHYFAKISTKKLVDILLKLKEYRYIAKETTENKWIYLCTGNEKYKKEFPPIMWNKEVKYLAFLINELLDSTPGRDRWYKASSIFRIRKGSKYEFIKPDNLRRASLENSKNPNSKGVEKFKKLIINGINH